MRLAVIPARGGSKRIPRKNVKLFCGKPMLAWAVEAARESGYATIQNAWDAHLVRNQIAHQGSEFPLSQVEGRRVIKLYQNFFEEMRVI